MSFVVVDGSGEDAVRQRVADGRQTARVVPALSRLRRLRELAAQSHQQERQDHFGTRQTAFICFLLAFLLFRFVFVSLSLRLPLAHLHTCLPRHRWPHLHTSLANDLIGLGGHSMTSLWPSPINGLLAMSGIFGIRSIADGNVGTGSVGKAPELASGRRHSPRSDWSPPSESGRVISSVAAALIRSSIYFF